MPFVWIGAGLLGLLGVGKITGDAEGIAESAAKAAPWIAAGLVAFAVVQRVR